MNLNQFFNRSIQRILAPGAASYLGKRIATGLASGMDQTPVLDVGCGYGSPLEAIGTYYFGVDIDETRVRVCARRAPAVVADAAALPFPDSFFAASISIGLLHHLSDENARRSLREIMRVVRPGGRVLIFDGVRPLSTWRRPIAALIRALDKGRNMRTENAVQKLFEGISHWHFERVTYAKTGLEGLWCIGRAPER